MHKLSIGTKIRYFLKRQGYFFEGKITEYIAGQGYKVAGFDRGGFPLSMVLRPGELEGVEDDV